MTSEWKQWTRVYKWVERADGELWTGTVGTQSTATQWRPGRARTIDESHWEPNARLCTRAWFHCYDTVLQAVLLRSQHVQYPKAELWEAEARGRTQTDGAKRGVTTLRLVQPVPVPYLTLPQRFRAQAWVQMWSDSYIVEGPLKRLEETVFSPTTGDPDDLDEEGSSCILVQMASWHGADEIENCLAWLNAILEDM